MSFCALCAKMSDMKEFLSCKQAMESCLTGKKFAVAHLYKEEKAMDMHIHDCYEIYYSISKKTMHNGEEIEFDLLMEGKKFKENVQ